MTTRNGTDNGNVPNGNNYHSKENIKKVIVGFICVFFFPLIVYVLLTPSMGYQVLMCTVVNLN